MGKSALKVTCKNGTAEICFPYEINAAKIGTVAPLTLGVVTAKTVVTETAYTDTITLPEGDQNTGSKERKAVLVFKHIPTSGDPRIHRISIPAPDTSGDAGGIYTVTVNGVKGQRIPAKYEGTGTAPGKDGNELATLLAAAMDLTGTFRFLSGRVIQD